MTRPTWTLDHIREELDWIMQYGKAQIISLDPLPSTESFRAWDYGWYCWCGDGYREDSWEKAARNLEIHMWSGFHK